ncbi:hypothetical protein AC1031_020284 [Aphanomyces cochlioides]|nr:hypothetical protein AC1031_020284 [Aphanomyces cochlioides]
MIAAQLDVYNMAELEAKNPVALDATKGMTQYDANMSCPLVVVAPIPSAAEGPYKKQRVDIDPDPAPEPKIDISGSYVIIPGALLQPASIGSNSDILLYRRAQVEQAVAVFERSSDCGQENWYIVRPPGTDKSVCTLSFLASVEIARSGV